MVVVAMDRQEEMGPNFSHPPVCWRTARKTAQGTPQEVTDNDVLTTQTASHLIPISSHMAESMHKTTHQKPLQKMS
jgi:hypothetical protein